MFYCSHLTIQLVSYNLLVWALPSSSQLVLFISTLVFSIGLLLCQVCQSRATFRAVAQLGGSQGKSDFFVIISGKKNMGYWLKKEKTIRGWPVPSSVKLFRLCQLSGPTLFLKSLKSNLKWLRYGQFSNIITSQSNYWRLASS